MNSTTFSTVSQARKPRKRAFEDDGSSFTGGVVSDRPKLDTTLDPPDYAESDFCLKHLVPFLRWLMGRHQKLGGVTEIRIIADKPTKAIYSGYYDPQHLEELVEHITPEDEGPRSKIPYGDYHRVGEANFYFSMQPAKKALLARSANAISRGLATTSDKDIIAYHLFAVDVDSERPAGISATAAEKAEARKVADAVRKWFKKRGVDCIVGDSGNGFHLLVPTIPYKDVTQASENAHTLLQLLDKEFSTDQVKIDTTIYNPSRILKLYGTKAVKGSSIPERPHRYATIDLKKVPADVDLFKLVAKELADFCSASQPAKKGTAQAKKETAPTKASAVKGKAAAAVAGDDWDAETSNKVLQAVLEKSGLPIIPKEKKGDTFYQFEDCPFHTDPDHDHHECCVIVRANGSFAAKCQHESKAGWKDYKPLIHWDENIGAVLDELGIQRKSKRKGGGSRGTDEENGCIVSYSFDAKGIKHTRVLTNFTARIVRRIFEDDETDQATHKYEVCVRDEKGSEETIVVPVNDFDNLGWLKQLKRVFAYVEGGLGTISEVRATICRLSGKPPARRVYTHTGWRKHKGQMIYLHAGGAIGPEGPVPNVRVRLDDTLRDYDLLKMPKESAKWDGEIVTGEQLKKAIRASLAILDVAPKTIAVPLLASVYRVALGNVNFSGFVYGITGKGKTSVAALGQQHWGFALNHENVPFSADSTSNANQELLYLAKDVLAVVDDYVESGTPSDIQKARRELGRTLRAKGNNQGRLRLRSDSTIRKARHPRAMPWYTGEQHATVRSLLARAVHIEVRDGDVDFERLTECQKNGQAGLYAQAMAAFVRAVAAGYDRVMQKLAERKQAYRTKITSLVQHRRTPTVIADLYAGMVCFLTFAKGTGAISAKEHTQYCKITEKALRKLIEGQNDLQQDTHPADRLLDLLKAAVQSGRAYVADLKGACPDPTLPGAYGWQWREKALVPSYGAEKIGWVDGKSLYLFPKTTIKVAESLLGRTDDSLGLSTSDMGSYLLEREYLLSDGRETSQKRITVRRTVEDKKSVVVYDVKIAAVIPLDRSDVVPG